MDAGGRAKVIGSAWRRMILHAPSSRPNMVVTQRNRHQFVATIDLGSEPLDLDDVPEIGHRVLGDALKADGLAIPVVAGGPFHGLGGLFPSLRRRTERIGIMTSSRRE